MERTSFESLFQTFPGDLVDFSGAHLARRDTRNLFHLKSWGSNPDVILIDFVPEGNIVVMFQTGHRGVRIAYKTLKADQTLQMVSILDANWVLVDPSESYAFHKELSGQDKVPALIVDQIRSLLPASAS